MNSNNDSRSRFAKPISKQKRILIIDDEEDITISLSKVLEQYGFRTDYFVDPVVAYSNFKGGQYDLVILDIKMPEIDGFDLYKKIREIDSRIKICFLTATEFSTNRLEKNMDLILSKKHS